MPARSVYRWENPPGKGPVWSSPTIQGGRRPARALAHVSLLAGKLWGRGRAPAAPGLINRCGRGGGSVSRSPGGAGRGAAGRPAGAQSRTSDRTHVRHRPRHVTGPASDSAWPHGSGFRWAWRRRRSEWPRTGRDPVGTDRRRFPPGSRCGPSTGPRRGVGQNARGSEQKLTMAAARIGD
jgi:hypothetical protein